MGQEELKHCIYSEFADDEDFQELIELFVNSIPHKREQLSAFHESNELEQLQTLAHQLKGAGGGYGFPGLTDVAGELEMTCKNCSLDDLDAKVDELLEYLLRVSM